MRALIALLLAFASPSASAQPAVACTSGVSAGTLAFGTIVPFAPAGASALLGELVVRCSNTDDATRTVRVRIAISAGASGNAAQRQMHRPGAAAPLLYNLYEDPAYSIVWTDRLGGRPDEVVAVPARASAEVRLSVFGRVPGRQTTVTAGMYSDTLTATIRY